jgi:hypothetical protein
MRQLIAAAALLLLVACGSKSSPNEANVSDNEAPPAGNELSAANSVANESTRNEEAPAAQSEPANAIGTLPPADAALRFVGSWATSQANCASKPWRFTADELTATGGPHCSIYKVTKVPGGYDLAAQCPTKKPVPTDLIKVRFAESARAMLVESNAISPMGLVYCRK